MTFVVEENKIMVNRLDSFLLYFLSLAALKLPSIGSLRQSFRETYLQHIHRFMKTNLNKNLIFK
jgi:hypothetical protein